MAGRLSPTRSQTLILAGLATAILLAPARTACAAEIPDNPSGGAIAHHALRASIDPATAHLSVVDTLTIVHRPGVPASTGFPVLLARGLTLESVLGIDVAVKAAEGRIQPREYWNDPPYDELEGYERARTIAIAWDGKGSTWPEEIRVVVRYAGALYDSLRAPKAAYARGFETTSGLIDPRGAYLCWSSFWVPQRPDERFTFRAALDTPAHWHAVSQGKLTASVVEGERRTNHWDSPQPMEEIYFVAGYYTLLEETHRGVSVMTFTYPYTDEDLCRRYIDGTRRYLDLYVPKIGRYPFAKFALVENFWQTGFGMPSFTLLGDRVIRLPFILDTSYGHEILHNWWGNGVFVDYRSGNWCEGLTAYGADYLYKAEQSDADAKDYRRSTLQGYLDYVSDQEDMPLRSFRERHDYATQAIGYGKALMVYHQVFLMLGETRFWRALSLFYERNIFRRASWDDLFAVFSEVAGRDLTPIKNQWLERTGAPSIALRDYTIRKADPRNYEIAITIMQTQPEMYDLRVPVAIGYESGGAILKTTIHLHGLEGRAIFEARLIPDYIAIDPDFDVLRRIDPAEIPPALSRTLGADSAVVVIAGGLAPDLRAAYEAIPGEWGAGTRLAVLHEEKLPKGWEPGVPVWFLGLGPMARARLIELGPACGPPKDAADGWTIAGTSHPAGLGAVLAGGPPDRPQAAWSLIAAADAAQATSIGKKVPHYGKYGYLLFEGGANVAKGSWEVTSSPMRVAVDKSRVEGPK